MSAVAVPQAVAIFTGSGLLAALGAAVATAAFTGDGTLIVPTNKGAGVFAGAGSLSATAVAVATAPFTGAGTLSAQGIASATAAFSGAGTLVAAGTPSAAALFTGVGTLSATATTFKPSGMTKNGNYNPVPTSYTTVPAWTANTTTYPGSTVSSDGVVAQGSKSGATLTTRLSITNTAFGTNTITVKLLVNGVTKVTGTAQTIGSTATQNVDLTGTADVANGDIVTVQVFAGTASPVLQVNTGTGSYVTIT
ncbi:hypothetical protein ACFXON_24410 [Bacillus subtilis]